MRNEQWQPMIAFGLALSAWVAGPIIVAYGIGSWLDKQYGTQPWLLLGCIGTAFIISNIGIVREAKRVLKAADNQASKNKLTNDNNPKH